MTVERVSDVSSNVNAQYVSEKDVRSGPSVIRTRDADGQGSRIQENFEDVRSYPSSLTKGCGVSFSRIYFPLPPALIHDDRTHRKSLFIPTLLQTVDTGECFQVSGLLDSGATHSVISKSFVKERNWNVYQLNTSFVPRNFDGSRPEENRIDSAIDLIVTCQNHSEKMSFLVAETGGKFDLVFGHDWLVDHNPEINWISGKLSFTRCTDHCSRSSQISLRAMETISQKLFREYQEQQGHKTSTLPPEYQEFASVFEKKEFDKLPPHTQFDHAIDLKPDAQPRRAKVYPLSTVEQQELDKFLDEHLSSGRIRPSKSPMASPFFFVKKKGGDLRPVQDYRALNEMTVKNAYPLPLISELIDKLRNAQYFTALDVRWGYNNIRIKEGDEWKAAFITNRGLFEPLVMYFGLCNSPATFQTMMNNLFHIEIAEGVVLVYMDDILIFTVTLEQHHEVVKRVLRILRDNNLTCKLEKCTFQATEIDYLGFKISPHTIAMDPAKINGVADWPVPKKKKDVQSFLGFINFYRRFVRNFSSVARPLHDLTKDAPWEWTEKHQQAFDQLKRLVTSSPILRMPTDNDPFRLETDASDYAIGAVLMQRQDDIWHTVAYMSKSMSPAERNYPIFDKELLAIIRALEEWRHYLEGQPIFEIWTDHKNLEYFRQSQRLTRRQARWSLFLSRFSFTLHHKPGSTQIRSDALSRREDHKPDGPDNNDQIMLKDELFIRALTVNDDIFHRIRDTTKEGTLIADMTKNNLWSLEDGFLYNDKRQILIPLPLRRDILSLHHDEPIAGHQGIEKTLELIQRQFWWPKMRQDVQQFVTSCPQCQRTKIFPARPSGLLQPNPIPDAPWQTISIDLITGLPPSNTYNAICTIVDRFSKMVHLVPTHETVTSEGIARIYRDNVWKHHGFPLSIISDRGPQFASQFMRSLLSLLNITPLLSTAYHPQTDGQTERVNQDTEQYLRLFVNYQQTDWSDWLPLAEFVYNNRQHSATGHSPFFLNYGRHPHVPTFLPSSNSYPSVEAFHRAIQETQANAKLALERAAVSMKKYADLHRSAQPTYSIGDKVWLDASNLKTNRPAKKLDDKRLGPFPIEKVISPTAVRLTLPAQWNIHPVFHVSLIRPYAENTLLHPDPHERPAPLLVDNEEHYEVEAILNSRPHGRGLQYLVHWKGYPHEDDQWLPRSQLLQSCPEAIADFHRLHPGAPRLASITLPFQPLYQHVNPPPYAAPHILAQFTQRDASSSS